MQMANIRLICASCGKAEERPLPEVGKGPAPLELFFGLPKGWMRLEFEETHYSFMVCSLACLYSLLNKLQNEQVGKGED